MAKAPSSPAGFRSHGRARRARRRDGAAASREEMASTCARRCLAAIDIEGAAGRPLHASTCTSVQVVLMRLVRAQAQYSMLQADVQPRSRMAYHRPQRALTDAAAAFAYRLPILQEMGACECCSEVTPHHGDWLALHASASACKALHLPTAAAVYALAVCTVRNPERPLRHVRCPPEVPAQLARPFVVPLPEQLQLAGAGQLTH